MDTDTAAAPTLPISNVEDAPLHQGPSLADRFSQFKAEVVEQASAPEKAAVDAAPTTSPESQQQEVEPNATDLEPSDGEQPTNKPPRRAWGEVKKKADRADELEKTLAQKEQELTEFRQRNEELQRNDPTRYEAQIREKEKAIEDYEKRLAVYDVRESKVFKETIEAPLRKIAAKTANLAQMYNVNPTDLQQALQIENPAERLQRINELTAEFDPIHKGQVWTMAEESLEHLAKAWDMQQNAMEAKKELEFISAEEKRREQQESEKRLSVVAESVKSQFLEKVPFLKERQDLAAKVFAAKPSDDPAMSIYNAMSGELLAEVLRDNRSKDAKVKELEAELAKRASLGVRAGGGAAIQQAAASTDQPVTEGSAWQRARSWAATKS